MSTLVDGNVLEQLNERSATVVSVKVAGESFTVPCNVELKIGDSFIMNEDGSFSYLNLQGDIEQLDMEVTIQDQNQKERTLKFNIDTSDTAHKPKFKR